MSANEIICNQCHSHNTGDSLFCVNCGNKLVVAAEKPSQRDFETEQKEQQYQQGLLEFSEGNFETAIDIFTGLEDYRESPAKKELALKTYEKYKEQIIQAQHEKDEALFASGIEAFSSGDLATSERIFMELGEYPEARDKLELVRQAQAATKENEQATFYAQGIELFSLGQLDQAAQIFQHLGSYRDSASKLRLIMDNKASLNQSHYQAQVNQLLKQAYETTDSQVVGQTIGKLQQLGFNGQELVALEQKYHQLEETSQAQKETRSKKVKSLLALVAGVLLVFALIGGIVFYRINEAKELAAAVEKQRSINEESFTALDTGLQGELTEMLSSYGANPRDYTYESLEETADYTLISYTFKGPDERKDILPKKGTRLYNAIAFTRE